jgi:DnaJ-class molecular chaperone
MIVQQKCPICEGRGNVEGGFYNSIPNCPTMALEALEMCRNCKGSGVVHVKQEEVKDGQ